LLTVSGGQDDRIGRFFAIWATFTVGTYDEHLSVASSFLVSF
jgi:hypothetical protein